MAEEWFDLIDDNEKPNIDYNTYDLEDEYQQFADQIHNVPVTTETRLGEYNKILINSIDELKDYRVNKDDYKRPAELENAYQEVITAQKQVDEKKLPFVSRMKEITTQSEQIDKQTNQVKDQIANLTDSNEAMRQEIAKRRLELEQIKKKETELLHTASGLQLFNRQCSELKPAQADLHKVVEQIRDYCSDQQINKQLVSELNNTIKRVADSFDFQLKVAEKLVGYSFSPEDQKDETRFHVNFAKIFAGQVDLEELRRRQQHILSLVPAELRLKIAQAQGYRAASQQLQLESGDKNVQWVCVEYWLLENLTHLQEIMEEQVIKDATECINSYGVTETDLILMVFEIVRNQKQIECYRKRGNDDQTVEIIQLKKQ